MMMSKLGISAEIGTSITLIIDQYEKTESMSRDIFKLIAEKDEPKKIRQLCREREKIAHQTLLELNEIKSIWKCNFSDCNKDTEFTPVAPDNINDENQL